MKQRRRRNETALITLVFVPTLSVVLLTFSLIFPGAACAAVERVSATILRIIDGDTLIAKIDGLATRLRLAEIDAPELDQTWGFTSREFLATFVANRPITIHSLGRDRYNRTLATVFAGNMNINLTMVSTGHAWRYRYARKTGPIAEAEALARAEGRGIWSQAGPVAPWEFRSQPRQEKKAGDSETLAPRQSAENLVRGACSLRWGRLPDCDRDSPKETNISALCLGAKRSSLFPQPRTPPEPQT